MENHGKGSAVEAVARQVRASILRGDLQPGSALPGERSLSEDLGVSRLTLRSALGRLESEGLVQPVQGSGTRVLDFRASGGIDLLGHLAEVELEGGVVPVGLLADLLEFRRMVAVELLGLVAERATAAELDGLSGTLRRLARAVGEPERFMQLDLELARQLVHAGRNLALELLFNTGVRILSQHPTLDVAFGANSAHAVTVYERLLGLVRSRDAKRVRRVSARFLSALDRRTLERVGALARSVATAAPGAAEAAPGAVGAPPTATRGSEYPC